MHIDLDNHSDHKINMDLLETITSEVTSQDIELLATFNDQIQKLNNEFRGLDKPTDVLSFPYEPMPFSPIGSIVISVDFVQNKAEEYNHSFDDEFILLYIHGLLHLVGFDHEVDNGEHREEEERLIKKFNLPNSLIVRNS
ncbi:MAG: rRNA maturation RNase YbeY [Campylobacterales bacterium]|nr:rRNA maturation RNase YbeY [Campylobacterales bacterium]